MADPIDVPAAPDPRRLERTLERTVAEESFSAAAIRRMAAGEESTFQDRLGTTATQGRERTPDWEFQPLLTQGSLSSKAPRPLPGEPPVGRRYDVRALLGMGGSGCVFAARDHTFDREIAIKLLHPENAADAERIARFIREARVTAKLEHPNILPIYDMDFTDDGEIYFTMRRVEGRSLGEAIREAQGGRTPAPLATMNDRVNILLKVCDAVSFAHHRGIIHQDIKPDNIMLGSFGEVLLVDWGTAMDSGGADQRGRRGLIGTPAYMSPEQARRERADERSDVYCLGATLFQLVAHRHPTWASEPGEFWSKKQRGVIDPLDDATVARIPAPLLAICLKAMEADPERRYASASAMAEDLKRYQEGLAVSAHREGILVAVARWYRRNRRAVWTACAALLVIGATFALLVQEKLKERWSWQLAFEEDFDDTTTAGLSTRWWQGLARNWSDFVELPFEDAAREGWRVVDGALVGRSITGACDISYRGRIPGNLRVEWTVRSDHRNENFNCFISGGVRNDGYALHVGGYGDPTSCRLTRGAGILLDYVTLPEPLRTGREYRFRLEREGHVVRFFIDGAKIIDYLDPDGPYGPAHQSFGFDSGGNPLVIDDVRVWFQPLPERVSPLTVADSYYGDSLYERALQQYREIVAYYASADFVAQARFRAALCLIKLGRSEEALASLEEFERKHPQHELAAIGLAERTKIHLDARRIDEAERLLGRLAVEARGKPILKTAYIDLNDRLVRMHDLDHPRFQLRDDAIGIVRSVHGMLGRWSAAFGVRPMSDATMGLCRTILDDMGRNDLILELFPDRRDWCARALSNMGLDERVVAGYPDQRRPAAEALLRLGRGDDALALAADDPHLLLDVLIALDRADELDFERLDRRQRAKVLLSQQRYEEIANEYRDAEITYGQALLKAGRHQQILDDFDYDAHVPAYLCTYALLRLRRPDEALRKYAKYADSAVQILGYQAIEALRQDRHDLARERIAAIRDLPLKHNNGVTGFSGHLLPPFVDFLLGDAAGCRAQLRDIVAHRRYQCMQITWHDARLLLGEIDEDQWRAQPVLRGGENERLLIVTGMRDELAGRREAACDAYRRLLDRGRLHEPAMDLFARWRYDVLGGEWIIRTGEEP